jgi:hypothetical protein
MPGLKIKVKPRAEHDLLGIYNYSKDELGSEKADTLFPIYRISLFVFALL